MEMEPQQTVGSQCKLLLVVTQRVLLTMWTSLVWIMLTALLPGLSLGGWTRSSSDTGPLRMEQVRFLDGTSEDGPGPVQIPLSLEVLFWWFWESCWFTDVVSLLILCVRQPAVRAHTSTASTQRWDRHYPNHTSFFFKQVQPCDSSFDACSHPVLENRVVKTCDATSEKPIYKLLTWK
jgi:hypothetical protein